MKKILVLTLALNSACATILSGSSQKVKFDSNVESATVSVGDKTCTTPCEIKLDKGEVYTAKFQKTGYEPKSVPLDKSFNPIAILNLIGLIGWVVDASTGAVNNINPGAVSADLSPLRAPSSASN